MIKTCLALSPTKANFAPLLFSGDLEQGFKKAHELGYDGVELSLRDSDQLDQDEIIGQLQTYQLQCISFGTGQSYFTDGLSLADPDSQKQQSVRERLKAHIRFAAKLNSMVVIGSVRGVLDDSSEKKRSRSYTAAVEAVQDIASYAAEEGVVLLLEPINRYETNFLNTIQEALQFLEEVDSPQLKLLADTFHMNIEESDLVGGLLSASHVLQHIHLVDSNRCAVGMGHIDFNQIIKILKQMDYDGWLSAEILPTPDDEMAAARWIKSVEALLDL